MRFDSIRVLVRPIPQCYARVEGRPSALGVHERSILHRELRGVRTHLQLCGRPLAAFDLQILSAQLRDNSGLFHRATHDSMQRCRARDCQELGFRRTEGRSECGQLMKVVRRHLNLQAGITADGSLRGQGRRGNPQGRVVQRDGLISTVIANMNRAIDRNAAFQWIRFAAGESVHGQVRLGAKVRDAPLPCKRCFSVQRSGNSGAAHPLRS